MPAFLLTILSYVMNIPVVKRFRDSLIKIAIALAVLVGSNMITGVWFYVKGHNRAAEQCKIGSLDRRLKETERDLSAATIASAMLNQQLRELEEKQAAREQKDAEDAAKLKPIEGCTVPDLPKRDPRRVRHGRR